MFTFTLRLYHPFLLVLFPSPNTGFIHFILSALFLPSIPFPLIPVPSHSFPFILLPSITVSFYLVPSFQNHSLSLPFHPVPLLFPFTTHFRSQSSPFLTFLIDSVPRSYQFLRSGSPAATSLSLNVKRTGLANGRRYNYSVWGGTVVVEVPAAAVGDLESHWFPPHYTTKHIAFSYTEVVWVLVYFGGIGGPYTRTSTGWDGWCDMGEGGVVRMRYMIIHKLSTRVYIPNTLYSNVFVLLCVKRKGYTLFSFLPSCCLSFSSSLWTSLASLSLLSLFPFHPLFLLPPFLLSHSHSPSLLSSLPSNFTPHLFSSFL